MVRPKKHLGQHFLKDESIAQEIVNSFKAEDISKVIEIGPGTGVLTTHLLKRDFETYVVEIDVESIDYLDENFPELEGRILNKDFLKYSLTDNFNEDIGIIGNFPYNISSQILFKTLENKEVVKELVGMFQKEVAERVASKPGSKVYGILSVLIQAYYDVDYLFTVDEDVFFPPPKVKSGVIRLIRKDNFYIDCDDKHFFRVVKTGFNQRRKTLRNSLKSLTNNIDTTDIIFSQRPEQLSVFDFVNITNLIYPK